MWRTIKIKLNETLMRFAGKKDFKLDSKIESTYVIRLCIKYGIMLIRGRVKSIGYPNIARNSFWGKNVKLYSKKRIFIGEKTKIHRDVRIDALSIEGVKVGNYCVIGEKTRIECTGALNLLGKGVVIGDRTTFGSDCFFGGAGGIVVGEDVVAGQFIRFHSENHNYKNKDLLIKNQGVTHEGIVIGNNCWIGAGAVFLDGAKLGDGCVVAANAVVTKKYPSNVVIGGIPARVLKKR